ncbi:hypothetical protein VDQ60_20175 [Xanthomonas campestris pv. campestris]|nr:hypothetical protein [Xanthomonas campestris pv. campestris]
MSLDIQPPISRHFLKLPDVRGHQWTLIWWAHQDSNLEPKDYEFDVNAPCLGKPRIRQRKQQNKKVSCDSSLAQLGDDGQNSALYRLSTAIGDNLELVGVHGDCSHGLTIVTPVG